MNSVYKYVTLATLILLAAYSLNLISSGIYTQESNIPQDYTKPSNDSLPYLMQPNLDIVLTTTGEKNKTYRVRTNQEGFRSSNASNVSNNSQKVFVVGDSMAFGWGLNRSNRFTDICQRSTNNHLILNRGIPGYGMEDHRKLIEERIITQNPDTVVVLFSKGDEFSTSDTRKPKNYVESLYISTIKRINIAKLELEKSDLIEEMEKISETNSQKNTKTVYMPYWPLSEKDRSFFQNWAENQNMTEFAGTPPAFRNSDMQKYIFSTKDPHLNREANKQLAETLCSTLGSKENE